MYYMHSGYWTSIFGKNRAYYIRIFTVNQFAETLIQNYFYNI